MWQTERELRARGFVHIAGVDEAGRGPLAGPVVAAAVMLPARCRLPGVADSKALTRSVRERLFCLIQKRAICFTVACVDARTVDRVNVLRASQQAMVKAIGRLQPRAEIVLVDGWELPEAPAQQRAMVGGDRACGSIAAASIVAKVVRDRIMEDLDERYPGYGFRRHKGYATREHLARLSALGPCWEHRMTFGPVRALWQERLPLEGAG